MGQSIKGMLGILLSISLVFGSFSMTIAQGTQDACSRAKSDAKADVSKNMWMLGGCLFGIIGVGAAYIVESSPPASRLVGKPNEYVSYYTDCYKDEAKRIKTKSAWGGCIAGTALSIGIVSLAQTLDEASKLE